MQFIARNARFFQILFLVCLSVTIVLGLSACAAPAFLTDLEEIIPIALTAISGVLATVGTFTGNPELGVIGAGLSAIASKVEAGLQNIDALITQYKSNASETLLAQIENDIQATISDIQPLLTITGLPAAQAQQIQTLAQAIYAQLQALLTVLPVFKSSTAGQTLSVTKPVSAANFKAQVQSALKS